MCEEEAEGENIQVCIQKDRKHNVGKMRQEEAEVMEDLGRRRRFIIQRWKREKKWMVI